MPYVERSIQQYGVVIDGIHYYSDVLRRYINVPDLNNRHRKRSFIFKRDPRDISLIYFYDPEVKQYSGVPYRDTSRPAMSIWELRKVARQLKEGRKEINEALIFESYERMRVQEQEAVRKTRRVRRENQRRSLHRQSTKPAMIGPAELSTPKESRASLSEILPFEEMEELD
jgi:putative transposase